MCAIKCSHNTSLAADPHFFGNGELFSIVGSGPPILANLAHDTLERRLKVAAAEEQAELDRIEKIEREEQILREEKEKRDIEQASAKMLIEEAAANLRRWVKLMQDQHPFTPFTLIISDPVDVIEEASASPDSVGAPLPLYANDAQYWMSRCLSVEKALYAADQEVATLHECLEDRRKGFEKSRCTLLDVITRLNTEIDALREFADVKQRAWQDAWDALDAMGVEKEDTASFPDEPDETVILSLAERVKLLGSPIRADKDTTRSLTIKAKRYEILLKHASDYLDSHGAPFNAYDTPDALADRIEALIQEHKTECNTLILKKVSTLERYARFYDLLCNRQKQPGWFLNFSKHGVSLYDGHGPDAKTLELLIDDALAEASA